MENLLDGYTCTECGRCTSVCPANTTGKLLNPKLIVNKDQKAYDGSRTAYGKGKC
ncbi:MAG: 4Fe-4S dicluster domain-containing protein [Ignavibacteria bacterium]